MQHVYLRLHESWPDVIDPGRYALGHALKHFIGDQKRELQRRSNRSLLGNDETRTEIPEPGPGVEERAVEDAVEQLLREALTDALEKLPERQRRAVELTTDGEHSRADAGAAMGVDAGTVSSHRARGLRKLADVLGPIAAASSFLTVSLLLADIFRDRTIEAVVDVFLHFEGLIQHIP